LTLHPHPSRHRVLSELHARLFRPLRTPVRMLHFAFTVTAEEADRDSARIEKLVLAAESRPGSSFNGRYASLDNGRLRWERHGEFVSYTFEIAPDVQAEWPAAFPPPGALLVAIDLRLIRERPTEPHLVDAVVLDGNASIASDFSPDYTGFVRMIVSNSGMDEDMAGATVQRLQEIETYRCLAMLGLPVAEQAAITLGQIEAELPDLMEGMATATSLWDNRHLLDRLAAMSLELERSSAVSHFRFGATRAYAELVRLRLKALSEQHLPTKPGLDAFFSRRFDPAIRTCSTTYDREAVLARKLTRAAQLLRTRVEIALQSQNRDLLEGMGNRLNLSVAAIAYYVASLFHLVMVGITTIDHRLNPEVATAIAVPAILAVVSLAIHRLRHSYREPETGTPGISQSQPAGRMGQHADQTLEPAG
jgi:uncharacterized membrane-anchored protein